MPNCLKYVLISFYGKKGQYLLTQNTSSIDLRPFEYCTILMINQTIIIFPSYFNSANLSIGNRLAFFPYRSSCATIATHQTKRTNTASSQFPNCFLWVWRPTAEDWSLQRLTEIWRTPTYTHWLLLACLTPMYSPWQWHIHSDNFQMGTWYLSESIRFRSAITSSNLTVSRRHSVVAIWELWGRCVYTF